MAFGWTGETIASVPRIATLHSDACARDYLARVDRLRAKLRLSDAELCPAVPGECSGRVAQIEALRRDAKQFAERRVLAFRLRT